MCWIVVILVSKFVCLITPIHWLSTARANTPFYLHYAEHDYYVVIVSPLSMSLELDILERILLRENLPVVYVTYSLGV
jgi:hypothetical protein